MIFHGYLYQEDLNWQFSRSILIKVSELYKGPNQTLFHHLALTNDSSRLLKVIERSLVDMFRSPLMSKYS